MKSRIAVAILSTCGISLAFAGEPIQPIEAAVITEPGKVELGKKLFFEPRLSKSGFLSCNSCHNLALGGGDLLPTSIGHNWQQGPINAPTVLNAKYMLAQFWDGRAADLQEQAAGPIANPKEMALEHEVALDVLRSMPAYRAEFNAVYGDETISLDQVTDAIAKFEETLVTPDSRFDLWLKGDKQAITAYEQEGYELFKSSGCAGCHSGPAVGGTMYQKMGLREPFETDNPAQGRIDVTGKSYHRMVFKVPTLRNIDLTYPYFHDGSTYDLTEAVITMQKVQRGKDLPLEEAEKITAFLQTLTGKQPQIVMPILPPSNRNTPQPQPFVD
ncbi:cytochrome-c peroxidase [Ferrimonas lipolytica]|uniref:Cytochrome-c peroxidase n=1 Tax=Ferrimonas lipolytica TaxID=2724191 RepID=A0A6H1UGE6_9GAMM|nr:cytochrome-c peroxidase [Ferrimonas lipolytica]QIZ77286.1 cytochrome-c peroxidase [Ferrimonas lipolytica]